MDWECTEWFKVIQHFIDFMNAQEACNLNNYWVYLVCHCESYVVWLI